MFGPASYPVTVLRMILVSLLAIVTSVYYPLMVVGNFDSRISLVLMFASLLINGWDLIANYQIYRTEKGEIGTLSREMGIGSKRRWLAVDILAVIPYELLGTSDATTPSI
ncbi:MAG: hypothetical protein EDM75_10290 [Chlorobiota bacterium]|nr:MAG: hypothetical protein EDM75_10290 [Chlorobiota bacterium]